MSRRRTRNGSSFREGGLTVDGTQTVVAKVGGGPNGTRLYVSEIYTARVWWWEIAGGLAESFLPESGFPFILNLGEPQEVEETLVPTPYTTVTPATQRACAHVLPYARIRMQC